MRHGPLCPFSLAGLWRFLFIMAIWLRFKGSCALRGKGWAGGGWGTFSLGRGLPARTSCQDKARLSIERSSSCVRTDCANSIEHDPSAQASANKVIFPNLLKQKGDILPVLVLRTQSRQEPARTGSGSQPFPQLLSSDC